MRKNGSYTELTVLALLVSVFNGMLTCCICGFFDWISLPGGILGCFLSCYAICRSEKPGFNIRIVYWISLIITSLILLKIIGDILWWGHEPLFDEFTEGIIKYE